MFIKMSNKQDTGDWNEFSLFRVIDLGLPDGDGTDLIRDVYSRGYATDVMVITVFGDERHVIKAIEAGATGYILKDGSNSYIAQSILQLVDGGSPISAPIARYLLTRFHTAKPKQKNDSIELPHLTDREKDVLSQLSRGFNFIEIAKILKISPHTVTSHVKHIYRKLAVAMQLGLINIEIQDRWRRSHRKDGTRSIR